jgi:hypothetical protein
MLNIRALIIRIDANEAAIARMWMHWMIGMAQNRLTIQALALVSEIHNANSTSCVVRSHSVKLYNKSPITEPFPVRTAGTTA